ncbi:MAG: hypothetical protein HW413_126 [Thermoleophilia bacterium]|nr:hypothetical protein [Thermoleophilia bacterium]
MLQHSHEPSECRAAFAAWRGFESPLRGGLTLASCRQGGHELWWTVEAGGEESALAQLPPYVAARTQAIEVSEVAVP